jgi:hypothetical protein
VCETQQAINGSDDGEHVLQTQPRPEVEGVEVSAKKSKSVDGQAARGRNVLETATNVMGRQQRSNVASRTPTVKMSRRRRCGVCRCGNGSTTLMIWDGGGVSLSAGSS